MNALRVLSPPRAVASEMTGLEVMAGSLLACLGAVATTITMKSHRGAQETHVVAGSLAWWLLCCVVVCRSPLSQGSTQGHLPTDGSSLVCQHAGLLLQCLQHTCQANLRLMGGSLCSTSSRPSLSVCATTVYHNLCVCFACMSITVVDPWLWL